MFDAIVFRNSYVHDDLVDIGALAEALIFYGKVKIIGNQGTLKYILKKIPPAIFLDLIEREMIEFHFLTDNLSTNVRNISDTDTIYYLASVRDPKITYNEHAYNVFKEASKKSPQAKSMASKFEKRIREIDHGGFNQSSLLKAWENTETLEKSVSTILKHLAPEYAQTEKLRFKIEYPKIGFAIDTNIDKELLAKTHKQKIPMKQGIPILTLLSQLQYSYEASFFSASLDSELFVNQYEMEMQEQTLLGLWGRGNQAQTEISEFVDLTLENSFAIREAVNSGRINFYDVIEVIDSSTEFKKWIKGVPPEKKLIQHFYAETIKDSKLSRLPGKTSKWALFTGTSIVLGDLLTGGVATAASATMGAVDTFLADKIIGGWKPHQFVEGRLKKTFQKADSK